MRRRTPLVAAALLLALAWNAEVWGHSRRRLEPPRPAPVKPADAEATTGAPADGTPSLPGGSQAGNRDRAASLADLMREFNTRPNHPERPHVLLKLAQEALQEGQVAKAELAYGLAAALFPGTPQAARARQERLVLDFYRDLGQLPPLTAGRRFLEKAARLPAASPPGPALQEALREVWLAAERQLSLAQPTPLPLAEEVLALFELHPQANRPPEAALLVARLLRERGLAGEARQLLQQVLHSSAGHLKSRAVLELLELAWESHGLPEFLATLARCHEEKQPLAQALGTWLLRLEGPGPAPAAEAPPKLGLAGQERLRLWEDLAGQPLPPSLAAHILDDLAKSFPAGEEASRATRLHQAILEGAREELGLGYYQDRAGLSHVKLGQLRAAEEAFQALVQDGDPFWQLVGRTRLLDLELVRHAPQAAP